MFLLVLFCFFRRRQQVNNEVKHINRRLESLLCSFNPSPSGELEGGLYISDIGNGFTTDLQRNHNGVRPS